MGAIRFLEKSHIGPDGDFFDIRDFRSRHGNRFYRRREGFAGFRIVIVPGIEHFIAVRINEHHR
ncbi:hypothetical protein D3C86_2112690 [compost metagenome]